MVVVVVVMVVVVGMVGPAVVVHRGGQQPSSMLGVMVVPVTTVTGHSSNQLQELVQLQEK